MFCCPFLDDTKVAFPNFKLCPAVVQSTRLSIWHAKSALQVFFVDETAIGASSRLASVVAAVVSRVLGAGAGALGAGLTHLHSSQTTNCFPFTARFLLDTSALLKKVLPFSR